MLKVLGVEVEKVTEAEEDGPEVGTFSLLCQLSDDTKATPMGGQGFTTREEAEAAKSRVKFDGHFLTVEPAELKTEARDAELIFSPNSSEEERADAVASILRLVADLEHPAIVKLAFYDDVREVEVAA